MEDLALPAWSVPLVVVLGVTGMLSGAVLAQRSGFPLRAAISTAEAGLIVPSILMLLLAGRPVARSLGLGRIPQRTVILSLLAGLTLWMASLGLMSVQSLLWPPSEAFLESFRQLHRALRPQSFLDGVLSVAAIAVMPAVCEEIVFRGTVLPSLARWLPRWAAVLLAALLFGAIHLDASAGEPAFFRIPFAIAVGTGLGALRVVTGSLVPPILAHALLNTITFLTVLMSGAASEGMEDLSPLVALPLLVVGTGLSVLVMTALRRRPVPATS
jgi:membrane protease YdiL (CAAX protease family)